MDERRTRRLLILLLVFGLTARLAWTMSRPTDPAVLDQLPDQREYLEIAQNLRNGEGLSFADHRYRSRVYAYRTPGYPMLVAVTGPDVRITRLVQCLLDTSTIAAAYLLARRWFAPSRAIFAASIVAINPFLIYFSGLILTETLFTAMLAWGMVLLTDRRTVPWLAGGIILALSALVRPGALALPVMLGVFAALSNRPEEGPYHRKWPLPVGTTMLLLTIAALLPWAYRNHRVLGEWVWTSTNGGITAYDGLNPDATGASDQSFVAAMPHLRGMSETERDAYFRREANDFVRAKPLRAMQLALVKIGRTWSPMPLSKEFSKPVYVAAALAFSVPVYLLIIAGLASNRLPASAKVFLSVLAVYLTIAAALSVGSLRYRIPAEVPMAVIATAALPAGRRSRVEGPPS